MQRTPGEILEGLSDLDLGNLISNGGVDFQAGDVVKKSRLAGHDRLYRSRQAVAMVRIGCNQETLGLQRSNEKSEKNDGSQCTKHLIDSPIG